MKRVRIEAPKGRRERRWLDVLPLDPRDPDFLRAKTIGRSRPQAARNSTASPFPRATRST
jgi:hypothetical protein